MKLLKTTTISRKKVPDINSNSTTIATPSPAAASVATPNQSNPATTSNNDVPPQNSRHHWPTPETPEYLIPRIGELPVSSTVHFQSVVMTSMVGQLSADQMWIKLRKPLIPALRKLARHASNILTGDDTGFSRLYNPLPVSEDELAEKLLVLGLITPAMIGASDHDGKPDRKQAHGKTREWMRHYGNDLDSILHNGAFWSDLFSGRVQEPKEAVANADSSTAIDPGKLTIISAEYGYLADDTKIQDVTSIVKNAQRHGFGIIKVTNRFLQADPAFGYGKQLRVKTQIRGVENTIVVQEWDACIINDLEIKYPADRTLVLNSTVNPDDPSSAQKFFLEPAPATTKELADRLTAFGLIPNDLGIEAEDDSMEDALNQLFGVSSEWPMDPLDAQHDSTDLPTEGVILYHEQGWFGRGIALGNLLHSVALAPGEVTQVAMTNWNHSSRATDSETESQDDSTDAADTQDRAVTEIQQAAAHEHTFGGSSASSVSASEQGGFSGLFVSGSAASTQTVSSNVSFSDGAKDLSMAANQQVNNRTVRHAEAARTRRAAVVREVTQSEGQNLSTRVLANYNHMHALTVMYFEVIEVFDLKTRVVDADRLIFLPFKVREVTELVPRFRKILVEAARSSGRPDLALALEYINANFPSGSGLQAISEKLATFRGDGKRQGTVDQTRTALEDARKNITNLQQGFSTQRSTLKTEIETLGNNRRVVLESLKAIPPFLEAVARAGVQPQLQVIDEQVSALNSQISFLRQSEYSALAAAQATAQNLEFRLASLEREANLYQRAHDLVEKLSVDADGGLQDTRLFLNQAAWLSLSPSEILGLARREYKGAYLSESLDPTPVAVSGNYIAYRWKFGNFDEEQHFKKSYVKPFLGNPQAELASVSSTIAVPTGGIFGEAVLGQAVSAEKIDLSRFWNWKESMIPILPTAINALNAATPTLQNLDAKPTGLDPSSAVLDKLQDLPAPSGFQGLAETMRSQMFRDMSGQDMLKQLATATTEAAKSGSEVAARTASENFKAGLDFVQQMAPTVMSAMAAPETGGTSLLGGLMNSKAEGAAGSGIAKAAESALTGGTSGGKGSIVSSVVKAAGEAITGGTTTPAAGGSATPAKEDEGEVEPLNPPLGEDD